jgi:hypothetical protein
MALLFQEMHFDATILGRQLWEVHNMIGQTDWMVEVNQPADFVPLRTMDAAARPTGTHINTGSKFFIL